MPVQIEGITFLLANEVADELGVSRQTFWRWRREGKVPSGRAYRDRQVIFTRSEIQQAREYANRMDALDPAQREQLRLFHGAT